MLIHDVLADKILTTESLCAISHFTAILFTLDDLNAITCTEILNLLFELLIGLNRVQNGLRTFLNYLLSFKQIVLLESQRFSCTRYFVSLICHETLVEETCLNCQLPFIFATNASVKAIAMNYA